MNDRNVEPSPELTKALDHLMNRKPAALPETTNPRWQDVWALCIKLGMPVNDGRGVDNVLDFIRERAAGGEQPRTMTREEVEAALQDLETAEDFRIRESGPNEALHRAILDTLFAAAPETNGSPEALLIEAKSLTKHDKPLCGRKKRQGEGCCMRPAGWGTNHVGEGACKLHGGNNIVKHGRYSQVRSTRIRELIAKHMADPEPLNVLPELATARSFLEDTIDRVKTGETPIDPGVVSGIMAHIETISRIVKRIEDIRSQDAISRPELIRVLTEMGRIAENRITQIGRGIAEIVPPAKMGHVDDLLNDAREKLQDDWQRIQVA